MWGLIRRCGSWIVNNQYVQRSKTWVASNISLKKCKNIFKNLLLYLLAGGKILSSIGQPLFGIQKFLSYALRNNDVTHPINIIGTSIVVLSSVFIHVTTRIPALFRLFRQKKRIEPTIEESEQKPSCCDKTTHIVCGPYQRYTSRIAYRGLQLFG